MRADRLVAALLLLQQRGRVTAAEVADELEVSVPTARRDLEALAASGVPVYPQRGRGGGWQLVGGARTDLSGLTASEAEGLLWLLGPAAGGSPATRTVVRKLLRALPAPLREGAEAAGRAVVVDPRRWGGEDELAEPAALGAWREAVLRRRRVRLHYRDARGRVSERAVDPWGVVEKDGTWYLLGGTAAGRRTFRLERVQEIEVTDEQAQVPADLDLARDWAATVEEVERRRSGVRAVLETEQRWLGVLRTQFGRHLEVLQEQAGEPRDRHPERVRVRVAASSTLDLARVLAGWGSDVVVLEPPELRDHLLRIGRALVAANVHDDTKE
ncbi:helix-turn-helix transcriptional regulator [Nocardioides nanhaiensis]|uniref:WYL domain-containing protein n=1 Tax=Nocardioides nanhaiensis TaxID=1476871 RepID=A0ABP8W0P2_9ACTN